MPRFHAGQEFRALQLAVKRNRHTSRRCRIQAHNDDVFGRIKFGAIPGDSIAQAKRKRLPTIADEDLPILRGSCCGSFDTENQ